MKTPTALLALVIAGCGTPGDTQTAATPAHVAQLDLYVMAKCPYGIQVEKAVDPLKKQLGNALDVHVNYIGQGTTSADFKSLHGPTEVTADIAQLCAAKIAPDAYFDMISCMNENPQQMDTSWKDCAAQKGIDGGALETCTTGAEGQQLLADSFKAAADKHATGSPTIFLDGQPYKGGRKTTDFLRAACATYGADGPQACKDIPVPPKVSAIFLTDSRCKDCDLHPLEGKLKSTFGGLDVKYVDYTTAEGKDLYAQLQAADPTFKLLPAALFTADMEKDADGYAQVQKYVTQIGDYRSLRVGAKFDPTAEICDNGVDDDSDASVDCADDQCAGSMLCRPAKPKTLDLFVMSHCPYGAKALVATADAMSHFGGDDIDLHVHYIGQEKDGQLSSMHGPTEVDDDIREVCAQEKYPKDDQFVKYMACISKDVKNADWKDCATDAGMNPTVIQTCFDGEGKDLLRKSFATAAELNIGSSPTFLVNNKRTFNAIAPDKLQQQYCQDNPGLAGCSGTITQDAAAAAPVPAGACGQ